MARQAGEQQEAATAQTAEGESGTAASSNQIPAVAADGSGDRVGPATSRPPPPVSERPRRRRRDKHEHDERKAETPKAPCSDACEAKPTPISRGPPAAA